MYIFFIVYLFSISFCYFTVKYTFKSMGDYEYWAEVKNCSFVPILNSVLAILGIIYVFLDSISILQRKFKK